MANRLFDEPDDSTTVLALVRNYGETPERYVFIFDNTKENRAEVLRVFSMFACNKELGFSWYDAVVLTQKVRSAAAHDEQ